jgi:axial budding pattern protein 2
MLVPLLFVFSSVMTVYSSPLAVVNPLDAQLPVIARINQPFSWTFCNDTFRPNDSLVYSTSSLPGWLSFDSKTRTFFGTPSEADEGNPKITVTASDPTTSVSSTFTFCVTPFPPPTLKHSISEQFTASNTALSSVFVLAPNSALATANPALRIPPQWSFSIGFQYDTFVAQNGLFYAVLQSGAAALPEWLYFDPGAMTLNGITPNNSTTLALALHASDQEGYTASKLFFDLCISSHELSISNFSMPTINVTASTPFNITLSSPADFAGVLVDAKPIQPSEIQSLTIDVSGSMQWLKYDNASRMLSGDPGDHSFSLGQNLVFPFNLVAYNQSIQSNVSLAFVPSYFSKPLLDPIQAVPGGTVQFNLAQDYSNATGHDDVKLSAEFDSTDVMEWLHFDCDTGQLAGTLPAEFSSTHISVTFTAYSRITHSTSHTTLPIVVSSADRSKKGSHPGGLSALAHRKLVLGLAITFGVVGGLILIGGLLAAFRRYARVDDTATGGEEGRNVWNDQDKRWYGLDKVRNSNWTGQSVTSNALDTGHEPSKIHRSCSTSQRPGLWSPGPWTATGL